MSPKFAKVCWNQSGRSVMIHGVCCISRGIPKCIIQDIVTKKEELMKHRNTVKAAVLVGDSRIKNLVALFFIIPSQFTLF